MKLAYLIYDYINPGGIERVIAQKANYLNKLGHEIAIITLHHTDVEAFFAFDPEIKFYDLAIPEDKPEYKALFVERLTELLMQIKPNITISTGIGLLNYAYEVKDGSKKIIEIHFAKYKRKYKLSLLDKYKLGRFITNIYSKKRVKIVSQYDKFVVLTAEDKESWGDLPNIEIIPNPLSFIPNQQSSLNQKKVVAIGRYTNQKGFNFLIDIWGKVNEKFPDWTLDIYGQGNRKKDLELQIKKNGISNIRLNPPSKEVPEILINSSIYVMTSRYEGLPLVLMEAMASSLPAIAYSCKCGPRDLINDGENGFLIKQGKANEFAEKLSLLMGDQDLRTRMGQEAHLNIMRFTEEKIMPKWIKLFEELTIS